MYYSTTPLSLEEATKIAPAISAQHKHYSRSNLYEYIPTVAILRALQDEGFNIHGVQAAGVKNEFRDGFQKHVVRLRKTGNGMREVGDECPELVVENSHDGSSAYKLWAGVIVLLCKNGLVSSNKWGSLRVKHSGHRTIQNVVEGSHKIVETFDVIMENVGTLKKVILTEDEQEAYAKKAMSLRFEQEETQPVTHLALLGSRRAVDEGDNLWKVFNRVQENLTKGGLTGRRVANNGKFRKTRMRAINGIDGNLALNQQLWALTEDVALSKGVQLSAPN